MVARVDNSQRHVVAEETRLSVHLHIATSGNQAYLILDDIEPLGVDLQVAELLEHDLGENGKLVVVSVHGEDDAIGLRVEGVAQPGKLGIVRVLGERISHKLRHESRVDRVQSSIVDDWTVEG